MYYPEPLLVVRHFAFRRRPDGRPHAIFRSNSLNPRAVWGLPVPFYIDTFTSDLSRPDETTITFPVLVYGLLHVPLNAYLPALEATAHYPDDADIYKIDLAHSEKYLEVHHAVEAIRVFNPTARGGTPGFNGQDVQDALTSKRDEVAAELFFKLINKYVKENPKTGVDRAFKDAALRTGMSQSMLTKVMYEKHNFERLRQTQEKLRHEGPRITTDRQLIKLITNIAQIARSNHETRFSIHDLAVPGGMPQVCPVTGRDLLWYEPESMWVPRVIRYDVSQKFVTGNVLMASRFAQKFVDATCSVDVLLRYMREDEEKAMRAWLEKYPNPDAESLLKQADGVRARRKLAEAKKRAKEEEEERRKEAERKEHRELLRRAFFAHKQQPETPTETADTN